jgi:hypothetical protein
LTNLQTYEARAVKLMTAICDYARRTGRRRVDRNEVAASIGIDTPVEDLTKDAREFVNTMLVLKHKGYIRGPVNYEWIQLTSEGIRACEANMR